MSNSREWRVDLYKDLGGELSVALYECGDGGQWALVVTERFGPTDTAYEVSKWLTRHWGPRARLPLR